MKKLLLIAPELYYAADKALYYVKEHGRNGYHIFQGSNG